MILLLLLLSVSAGHSRTDYDSARESYYALQDSQKKKLFRHNWQKTINLFADVYQTDPEGKKAADALYMAGKTSLELYAISGMKKDARAAAAYLDQLPQVFPKSRLADDALEMSAKIHEDILDEPTPAYQRYKQIVDDYAGGDMHKRALKKVKLLAKYTPDSKPQSSLKVSAARQENNLRSIRFWSNPGYTRIVLEIGTQVNFTSNFLKGDSRSGRAPRIYVDLEQTMPSAELALEQNVNDGLLKKIRAGQPDAKTTRVVLDIESFRDYKIIPYEEPFRIVIDVYGEDKSPAVETAVVPIQEQDEEDGALMKDSIASLLAPAPKERPLKVHIPESRIGGKLRRIVVDAGHGGRDPGAIGPRGTKEKDVVLALAKILAKKLEHDLGCEVIMTRTGNTFLQLEERTAIANKVKADLFISIHANASTNRRARGVETYYLNFSKNAKAVEVVARENKTSLKQVGDLEMILLDLLANSKINESSRLAAEIQKSMVSRLYKDYKVRDLGVKQGPFYVLLGATMPSVLVETAFISNHDGEKRLKNKNYQEQTADAIVTAVRNYATALNLLAVK
jgi:N-acetylmuramoyl-L-alanine amidase